MNSWTEKKNNVYPIPLLRETQNAGYAEYKEAKYVYAVLFRRNAKDEEATRQER